MRRQSSHSCSGNRSASRKRPPITTRRSGAAISTSCSSSMPRSARTSSRASPAPYSSCSTARAIARVLRSTRRNRFCAATTACGATSVANPLLIETADLATPQQSGALVLFLVAYYGLFASVMGGMAVALDTTAGERERQSLEPLLTTPARPFEIVVGKWLAVCLFDALVVTLTLTGFYLTLAFAPLPPVGVPFLFGVREF